MKKRLLAIAFVMLMFPMALLLTACGGSLKTGVNYVYDDAEIVWASNEEKELFLGKSGMTEEEMLAGMVESASESSVVFNEDGTVVTTYGANTMTMYYVVEGSTIKVYRDEAKTESAGEMKIVGDTLVQEDVIMQDLDSKIKMIYKVAE